MPRATIWAIPLVVLIAALSGCGTLLILPDEPPQPFDFDNVPTRRPYGGVRLDLEPFPDANSMKPLDYLFLAVDVPLCFIGDTLTLPYVLWVGPGRKSKRSM